MYPFTVDLAFGPDAIDFAALVKLYNEPVKEDRRKYSPRRFIGATIMKFYGNPDDEHVSTSYIERSNLTSRISNRRMPRP
jgi:hypothetical protein